MLGTVASVTIDVQCITDERYSDFALLDVNLKPLCSLFLVLSGNNKTFLFRV